MANKRDLKNSINCVCSDVFAECVAASLNSEKPNQETMNALLVSILGIRANYVGRISHPEPGMKPRLYFKDLINNFNKEIGEVVDQINAME